MELLYTAFDGAGLHGWRQTAWLHYSHKQLCEVFDSFVAISHVWSDGTGGGNKGAGYVHSCLFEFFAKFSITLGCNGFWLDTISHPSGREPKRKAMDIMLETYERATYTVIHDEGLTNFEWRDDGSPAVALVLSTWFTRGWTAAELYASRHHPVKVIFKKPGGKGVVMKDLDNDVLASWPDDSESDSVFESRFASMKSAQKVGQTTPDFPRLGHFVASNILRMLRSSSSMDRGLTFSWIWARPSV